MASRRKDADYEQRSGEDSGEGDDNLDEEDVVDEEEVGDDVKIVNDPKAKRFRGWTKDTKVLLLHAGTESFNRFCLLS